MKKISFASWRWQRVALAVLITGAILVVYFQFDEPLRRHFRGVKAGVTFQGEPVEGLFRPEVAALVARVGLIQGRLPIDAVIDEQSNSIIPELNGIAIDQEATIEQIMKAPRGAAVLPVYRELVPSLCWDHYPSNPVYHGNSRKPEVALMVNVAWGGEYLPAILSLLESQGAGATFFLSGCWAEKNESLIRRIKAGGHELGNHGYSDAEVFPDLDGWAMALSLRKTNEIIFNAAGNYPLYFTPHKGEFNDLTLEIVSRQGMRTVLWSLDTVDWQKPGVKAMRDKIMRHLSPGQIILMHPTEDTEAFLAETIPLIKEKGLHIVTVGELLNPSLLHAAFAGEK